MSGVISRSEAAQAAAAPAPAHRQHVFGRARIAFEGDGAASRLAGLYQTDPLRVLFPRAPAGDIPGAALVTTSGGLTATAWALGLGGPGRGPGCRAAEKVCRSAARIYRSNSRRHGRLAEMTPQETILFDGAVAARRERFQGDARVLAGEIVVFGAAIGEICAGLLNVPGASPGWPRSGRMRSTAHSGNPRGWPGPARAATAGLCRPRPERAPSRCGGSGARRPAPAPLL